MATVPQSHRLKFPRGADNSTGHQLVNFTIGPVCGNVAAAVLAAVLLLRRLTRGRREQQQQRRGNRHAAARARRGGHDLAALYRSLLARFYCGR
eukprot:COSAG06_NODE_768_length_12452_cov_5.484537_6_plen_94_part_00